MRRKRFFARKKARALKDGLGGRAAADRHGARAARRSTTRQDRRPAAEAGSPREGRAGMSRNARGAGPAARRGPARRRALFAEPSARAARRSTRSAPPARRTCTDAARVVIGFIGDEVVVNGTRLPQVGRPSLVGFARDLREREIEKITFTRGVTREEIRALHLRARATAGRRVPLRDAAEQRGRPPHHHRPLVVEKADEDRRRHRGGAPGLRHRGRDRRDALAGGQGRRQAGSGRRAQDHRQPRQAGRRRTARR